MGKNMTWRLLLDLALLRKRSIEDFDFPLWQANLLVVFLGILSVQIGLDVKSLVLDSFFGVFISFLTLFLFAKILLWWLRKGESEFHGDFLRTYKLAVAASGIDIIFLAVALGYSFFTPNFLLGLEYAFVIEWLFELAATLYSLMIFVYAFSNVFGLSKRHVLSGSVISGIFSFLISVSAFILLLAVFDFFGFVPDSYYE